MQGPKRSVLCYPKSRQIQNRPLMALRKYFNATRLGHGYVGSLPALDPPLRSAVYLFACWYCAFTCLLLVNFTECCAIKVTFDGTMRLLVTINIEQRWMVMCFQYKSTVAVAVAALPWQLHATRFCWPWMKADNLNTRLIVSISSDLAANAIQRVWLPVYLASLNRSL